MRRAAVYLLFFLSGTSGLVYQVVWVRQFGNLFGNTVYSAALVTALFMCGLGVGGYLGGVWADRRGRDGASGVLLTGYGALELGIGTLGVSLALAMPAMGALAAGFARYTPGPHGWYFLSVGSEALRYALAVAFISPITILMGATLTLLARYVVASEVSSAGWWIGLLYGLNTAGAALGAFLSDFALVPHLGLARTQFAAAAINALVGVTAIALARRDRAPVLDEARTQAAPLPRLAAGQELERRVVLTAGALALTGFVGMGLEILWFRFLTCSLGPYRAVFSLLLMVILVGLCLGALAGGRLARQGRPVQWFLVTEALLVVAALALLASFDVAWIDGYFRRVIAATRETPPLSIQLFGLLQPIALMCGLPALLMGFAFPLANACAQQVEEQVGRRAGVLYLANTLGSVVGSLGTGFVLIPLAGSQGTALVIALAAGAALPLLHAACPPTVTERPLQRRSLALAGGLVVLSAGAWLGLPEHFLVDKTVAQSLRGEHLLARRDGVSGVLMVEEYGDGTLRLLANGHSMSGANPRNPLGFERYMRAFVHVPLLLLDQPADALVICYGVGNTLHAATLHRRLERIEVVELSRDVLELAGHFPANAGALRDPRVKVFVNDGKLHLRMRPPASFDLITLEPPPIAQAGVSALYSREFYALARDRLRPGGMLSQWLPAYQVDDWANRSLIRAFVDVFPEAVLLVGDRNELILLGRKDAPLQLDPAAAAHRLAAEPEVRADLERISLASPVDQAGLFAADEQRLVQATAGVRPVTDDDPTLEYRVASNMVATRLPPDLFAPEQYARWCPAGADGAIPGLDGYARALARYYHSEQFLTSGASPKGNDFTLAAGDADLPLALRESPYLRRLIGRAADEQVRAGRLQDALVLWRYLVEANPENSALRQKLGFVLFRSGRAGEAEAEQRRAIALDPTSASAYLGLGTLLDQTGRPDQAGVALRQAVALAPDDGPCRAALCDFLVRRGEREAALPHCRAAAAAGVQLSPAATGLLANP